jgi:hypothetical protein
MFGFCDYCETHTELYECLDHGFGAVLCDPCIDRVEAGEVNITDTITVRVSLSKAKKPSDSPGL